LAGQQPPVRTKVRQKGQRFLQQNEFQSHPFLQTARLHPRETQDAEQPYFLFVVIDLFADKNLPNLESLCERIGLNLLQILELHRHNKKVCPNGAHKLQPQGEHQGNQNKAGRCANLAGKRRGEHPQGSGLTVWEVHNSGHLPKG